ncbi:site-specific integrase [Acidithiobacillus ferriphilus]|uniref:Integrase n=2 Tax=Acidithiobacillus TaxID=119977 RepID=A0A179BCK0_ACIFR|nr:MULTISPECIES: site-specific integrase [Acidithiobacillus]MEB8486699.1 site-specific integrase [Acidithiobacillus ferriphilus]MEB8489049.1 site-specific integrase [Acidithiobacillus ferriphilus]MEB8494397.1 site-specific integrase [Acidithiobacillus ferriphilus]MEB8515165.1 site-specific integrase [Acidithiobacillus ferriphilus]MEB8520641.1 site-specific integrase [Acidithiobacillus ferriphilus]
MLYKRGKTWWISFTTPNGQRIRQSAGTTEKIQAEELHDSLKAQSWRQAKLGDRPEYLWDDAGVRWIEEKGHKASLHDDIQRLSWLQTYLRGKKLREITREAVMEIVSTKQKETTAATANRYLALIRAILRICVEWGWLESAPQLRQYKEPAGRVSWLTEEQAQRLLEELPDHLKDMAEFTLATGLRRRNVMDLEWSQIDMSKKLAWIHPDQAKSRKAIGVPLGSVAIAVLHRRLGQNLKYVFTYDGHPVTDVTTKAWYKALSRAGVQPGFRWHDLRHTWASWHAQRGTPLHVLQELGGWSSSVMVQRYAHLSTEHLSGFVENVSPHAVRGRDTNLSQWQNEERKKLT